MTAAEPCPRCGQAGAAKPCPRCGSEGVFPNVAAAADPRESDALDARLRTAWEDLRRRNAEAPAHALVQIVRSAVAVVNCSFHELMRLAHADDPVQATCYEQFRFGRPLPRGERWDRLRWIADQVPRGEDRASVHFAVLSPDGTGLAHGGECTLVLDPGIVEQRATVVEENSIILAARHDAAGREGSTPPPGHRAVWARRADLCVAKLAGRIDPETRPDELARLLLSPATRPEDEDFVEVQVWEALTIRSCQRISVAAWASEPSPAQLFLMKARLDKLGLPFDFPPDRGSDPFGPAGRRPAPRPR